MMLDSAPIAGAFPTTEAKPHGVDPAWLVAGLLGLFALDSLLLLRFLGLTAPWVWATGGIAVALITTAMARIPFGSPIPFRRLAWCLGIGFAVMILGGEGRLLYANPDWLVRDAVLQDMARWPWPFLYGGHGDPQLLRAPLGMYLLPALLAKLSGGHGCDILLLIQNGLVAGALLALGSMLFDDGRARRIALIVFLAFSGMDTIGQLITDPSMLWPLDQHIEAWAGIQYSSTLTLAFWAPQHALAGWLGGTLFLLWRSGRAPLFPLLASVPLGMLWSPLAQIGILPFVALAGIETLVGRRLKPVDILVPAVACLLAWAGIRYMQVDPGKLGLYVAPLQMPAYALFEMLEVIPFLALIWLALRGGRFGLANFAIVAASLLLLPFAHVGSSVDLQMRGSVPALLILAVLATDMLSGSRGVPALVMAATLMIGALTPLRELTRAIVNRSTPATGCDLWSGADVAFPENGKENYFADATRMPAWLRPPGGSTLVTPITDGHCWPRPWQTHRWPVAGTPDSPWPLARP